MKTTLQFNDDEQQEALRAMSAQSMVSVLFEIRYNMRKNLEWWMDGNENATTEEVVDRVFEMINNEIEDAGIKDLINE